MATPIQLSLFDGKLQNGQAQFIWQTGEELNFQSFELEKSIDNLKFEKIATIQPKGNNSSYQFSIAQTEQMAYYRLKLIDQSGKTAYSNIVKLSQLINEISIYPNPAKDFITVNSDTSGSLYMYDQAGRQILSRSVIKGENRIPVSTLASGVYYIRINQQKAKFIKR